MPSAQAPTALGSQPEQDPHKPESESNHHLAGYALVAIGLLVLAGQSSNRLRPLLLFWPFLFVAIGLFLAAWSDVEIWPRGNLNWTWLVHHDLEARQHKIFAVLLMVMGLIEYLRVRDRLSRAWQIWAFPLLAVAGIGVLLSHDHGAGSGASSPEARNYVVSWLADATVKANEGRGAVASDPPATAHQHSMMSEAAPLSTRQTETHAPQLAEMETHHAGVGHQHVMTASMLKIGREHMWFALIGVFVIFFKVIHDSAVWRRSFVPFLWPTWIVVLGVSLVFYTE